MLRIAAVNMFADREAFEDARERLRALDYAEIFIPCGGIEDFEDLEGLRLTLTEGLRWQEQFGYSPWTGGLDALNDGFRDPPSFGPDGGLVVSIDDFQRLVKADRRTAEALLDIIECQSRNHLLFGRRLIALVRTDTYRHAADTGLGCRRPNWHAGKLPRRTG